MNKRLIIKNCNIINTTSADDQNADILIEGGEIEDINKGIESKDCTEIDSEGRIVVPGFIEVHIQGAGGSDVLDNSKEALENISKTLARLGTTTYLGTTVVRPQEDNKHLRLARQHVNKDLGGAKLLGFHLEGPFINPKKKGGLDPNSIYEPSPKALDEILDVLGDTLKMMTIAPEVPGNLDLIKLLVKNKVIASFAHSDANYEETKAGFEAGISHVTHLFNAMQSLSHRSPGPLGAIFENEKITAQLISDGHHLHPSVVNLAYKLLGSERCICITDGMQAMGLPEGKYLYNGREYISKSGAARYPDGTLIGSTMSLGNIAVKFMEFTKCSFKTAMQTITTNPAKLLGIYDKKGSVDIGKDADLVLLDSDYSVYMTIVNGQIVYKKK
ncbi:MAG: N-acetylglucosamine-6-phosphate deacetylase [Bacteroidota bacterium]|nr:N-acetylglucosamine-6-phosphate deacetylase [Bacteroidota bacterium]